ncbi:nicotinate (nicotinamide) nucleotide adenylyltransferase [Baaleninema sp.]|uniref:nicotinate (nicotinamide) nucleotide adenylyltransferase n=1 Tax=Baaleninema sp. TaxID=3101197 RepID=UPI003D08D9AF
MAGNLAGSHFGKLAVFGGTFDPVHCGHLALVEAARQQFDLEAVVWVPTYRPPHKGDRVVAPFWRRLEMVEIAIGPRSEFRVSAVEGERSGPSFAIDTLEALQQRYRAERWYWIVGSDAVQFLPRWVGIEILVRRCEWIVAPRAPDAGAERAEAVARQLQQRQLNWRWHPLDWTPLPISSSDVRRACRRGKTLEDSVPSSVADYLKKFRLYEDSP